ncbi:hypothetical protein VSR68_07575 [Paraburkholderia phymatum]|uniref:hypothetical protein n=1 Tax=Paraburkholderia phymatum TaxID=148447 RepID=UPI00316E7EE3
MAQSTLDRGMTFSRGMGRMPLISMFVGFDLAILLAVDAALGAVFSILFPLCMFISVACRYRSLLDYRVVYLFALTAWSFTHCYGILVLLFQDGFQLQRYTSALTIYGYGVLLSTLLVLFFWKKNVVVVYPNKNFFDKGPGQLAFSMFVLTSFAYAAAVQLDLSSLPLASMFGSFMLVAFAATQLGYANQRRWVALTVACGYASAVYSVGAANRTSMLVPMVVTGLALLVTCPRLNGRVLSVRTALVAAGILLIALLADWQKQMKMSLFEALSGDMRAVPDFVSSVTNSNYMAHADATLDYLSYVQYVIDHHLYHHGYWFMQVASSFTPRILFPDKPNFDISAILYEAHVVKAPMYFDFLFDRIIDSGLFGILIYNLGYLLLTSVAYRMYARVKIDSPLGIECGLYLASLTTLYLVMRGPIILIAWFYLFPMVTIGVLHIVTRIMRRTRMRTIARRIQNAGYFLIDTKQKRSRRLHS